MSNITKITSIPLQSVLVDLDGYRDNIARLPRGRDTRLFAFLDCLKQISNTAIGAKLLGKIQASGKQVTVCLNDQGKGFAHSRDLSVDLDPEDKKAVYPR